MPAAERDDELRTYARADGPFARVADEVSRRARVGRLAHFRGAMRITPATRIVDVAFVNSVIEQIPLDRRLAFASEVRRVAHWLPPHLRRAYWRLGVGGDVGDRLLTRREMETLFGPVVAERAGRSHRAGPSSARRNLRACAWTSRCR